MDEFLQSSNMLAASAAHKSLETAQGVGKLAIHTALLPITLPLHVTASTTGLVFEKGSDALHFFCDNIVPIIITQSMMIQKNPKLTATLDNDLHNRFQNELASRTKTVVSDSIKMRSTTSQVENEQSCYHQDDFLDRLRLDSYMENNTNQYYELDESSQAIYSVDKDSFILRPTAPVARSPLHSKYLLRVDDINVNTKQHSDSKSQIRVTCLDLDKSCFDEALTTDALNQLARRCIAIASSNEFVRNMLEEQEKANATNSICIDWNPLGQTKKDYSQLKELSKSEYYEELSDRVCTWTGKYIGEKYHGSENSFFMAQGVVPGSPSKILSLLWDSDRAIEYNKHCVSRDDIFTIIDDTTETTKFGFRGAKIIQSETKIPFTQLSIKQRLLLCAKQLGDDPRDGFIIFSRSLNCGHTGYKSNEREELQESKNQVILGVNIMRPVEGRPDISDLISISQVDASILPSFLRSRVGIMAVEDFFTNVRVALKPT